MTNRTSPVRRYSRFPVSWRMLYGTDEFLAEGTVLDLTSRGWRLAGSMPVVPGLIIALQVWVPDKAAPVRIHRATVLWVKDLEFAIEAQEMTPIDQAWVTEFLHEKLGLSWITPVGHKRSPRETNDPASRSKSDARPQLSNPDVEETLHLLLATPTLARGASTDASGNREWDHHEAERCAACSDMPEEISRVALRILRRMAALKADRERTGRDSIVDN